jgi:Hypothetical glycosyl hydrolase family 15
VIGLICVLSSSAPATASPSAVSLAGDGVCALGGRLGNVSSLSAYSMVIGDAADGKMLAGLPGTTLAYFDGTDVNSGWSTGVPYAQARAEGWLLKGPSGALLVNRGAPDDYIGDEGSDAYQKAWIANVLAYLHAYPGISGVYIDDVLYDLKPMTGVEAAEYPTQQAWADAQLSFIRAVGTALRARGYYVLVNASGFVPGNAGSDTGATTADWWTELGPYVSGFMNESYDQLSDGSNAMRTTGPSWTQNWDAWQRLIQVAQTMGKDFVGVTYGAVGDTQTMTYGKASFLLDWNGGGGAFIYVPTDGSSPTSATATMQVGRPAGVKRRVGVGWMRTYSDGVVLVDPSPSTAQTFMLDGTYLTASGSAVTSVTLSPATGMILRAVHSAR